MIKSLINNCNYQIQVEAVKYLVKILKYSNKSQRQEIVKYSDEFLESKNFYQKRLFYTFIEEVFEILSTNFIKECNLFQTLLLLFDDTNVLNLTRLLKFLPSVYPSIFDYDSSSETYISLKLEEIKNSNLANDSELLKVIDCL
jgi:hypothetical protein